MTSAVSIFYHIDPSLGKDGAACVKWGLAKWEKALKGQIKFDSRPKEQANWKFELRSHPDWPGKIAKCIHTGVWQADLIFDPREPWAKTFWQRAFGKGDCLRTYAAHEIGHALGLDHSDDPDSIMFHQPVFASIDKETLAAVVI